MRNLDLVGYPVCPRTTPHTGRSRPRLDQSSTLVTAVRGQGQAENTTQHEGTGDQRHADPEPLGESRLRGAGEEDGANDGHAQGAAELLGGAEDARCPTGRLGGNRGKDDIGQRHDQQTQAGPGDDQPGYQFKSPATGGTQAGLPNRGRRSADSFQGRSGANRRICRALASFALL
jgi:hypothetical protein